MGYLKTVFPTITLTAIPKALARSRRLGAPRGFLKHLRIVIRRKQNGDGVMFVGFIPVGPDGLDQEEVQLCVHEITNADDHSNRQSAISTCSLLLSKLFPTSRKGQSLWVKSPKHPFLLNVSMAVSLLYSPRVNPVTFFLDVKDSPLRPLILPPAFPRSDAFAPPDIYDILEAGEKRFGGDGSLTQLARGAFPAQVTQASVETTFRKYYGAGHDLTKFSPYLQETLSDFLDVFHLRRFLGTQPFPDMSYDALCRTTLPANRAAGFCVGQNGNYVKGRTRAEQLPYARRVVSKVFQLGAQCIDESADRVWLDVVGNLPSVTVSKSEIMAGSVPRDKLRLICSTPTEATLASKCYLSPLQDYLKGGLPCTAGFQLGGGGAKIYSDYMRLTEANRVFFGWDHPKRDRNVPSPNIGLLLSLPFKFYCPPRTAKEWSQHFGMRAIVNGIMVQTTCPVIGSVTGLVSLEGVVLSGCQATTYLQSMNSSLTMIGFPHFFRDYLKKKKRFGDLKIFEEELNSKGYLFTNGNDEINMSLTRRMFDVLHSEFDADPQYDFEMCEGAKMKIPSIFTYYAVCVFLGVSMTPSMRMKEGFITDNAICEIDETGGVLPPPGQRFILFKCCFIRDRFDADSEYTIVPYTPCDSAFAKIAISSKKPSSNSDAHAYVRFLNYAAGVAKGTNRFLFNTCVHVLETLHHRNGKGTDFLDIVRGVLSRSEAEGYQSQAMRAASVVEDPGDLLSVALDFEEVRKIIFGVVEHPRHAENHLQLEYRELPGDPRYHVSE